ncbi:hypothetical protein CDAR_381811 [Caerostris darwini]|uniref:Uncharacterized protein n=1 Tax=Caerostris darwini TaxID=1538125 RepID=A0AAV4V5L9_9ARAC|nr:hypothetical protein CDAR_381811 [Caerostris darwini]
MRKSEKTTIGNTSDTKSQFPLDKTKDPPIKTKLDTQLPKLKTTRYFFFSLVLNRQPRTTSILISRNPTPAAKSSPTPIKNVTSKTTPEETGLDVLQIKIHSRFRYLQTEKTARTPARDRWDRD